MKKIIVRNRMPGTAGSCILSRLLLPARMRQLHETAAETSEDAAPAEA